MCKNHFKGLQMSKRDKTLHKLEEHKTVGKFFRGSEKEYIFTGKIQLILL